MLVIVGCHPSEDSSSDEDSTAVGDTSPDDTTIDNDDEDGDIISGFQPTGKLADLDIIKVEAMATVVSNIGDFFGVMTQGNRDIAEDKASATARKVRTDTASEFSIDNLPVANVYPSSIKEDETNPFKDDEGNWLFPQDLQVNVPYNFILGGDSAELLVGEPSVFGESSNEYYPLTLTVKPATNIELNYTVETIWTKPNDWDPIDINTGEVDFTKRAPYYEVYFDGRRIDRTVIEADNGTKTFSENIDLSIQDVTPTEEGISSQDYYSASTFVVTLDSGNSDNNYDSGNNKITICHIPPGNPKNAHTITISTNAWPAHKGHGDYLGPCANEQSSYIVGKEFYAEDKDDNGILQKSVTKSMLQGALFNSGYFENAHSDTALEESYFSISENGVTKTYYIKDLGQYEQGEFDPNNLEKFSWSSSQIYNQSIGKSTKEVDGANVSIVDQYTYYKNLPTGKKNEFGSKFIELSGTPTSMTGTISVYYQLKKKGKTFKKKIVKDLPYSGDKTSFNISDFLFEDKADADSVFKKTSIYSITSTPDAVSRVAKAGSQVFTIAATGISIPIAETAEDISAEDADDFLTEDYDVSGSYISDKRLITLRLSKSDNPNEVILLEDATLKGDFVEGKLLLGENAYLLIVHIESGSGVVRAVDSTVSF